MNQTGVTWFVGPLPPPVHGFSNVCLSVYQRLRERCRVTLLNRAPQPASSKLARLAEAGVFASKLLLGEAGPLYLGVSGGQGQWIDMPFVAAARLRGRAIYLHHHSYAYLNARSTRAALLFALAGKATHVLLSPGMGARLCERYALASDSLMYVNNAVFMSAAPPTAAVESTALQLGPLRVGYLSNISTEKGIFTFFDLLDSLTRQGIDYRAVVAGPVDGAIKTEFAQAIARDPRVAAIGPVYGEAKTAFWDSIDVFVFPTKYQNEADPLVIHEALSAGVSVLSIDRGSIAEVLQNGGGEAFDQAAFVPQAVTALARLAESGEARSAARASARRRAAELAKQSSTVFEELLSRLSQRR